MIKTIIFDNIGVFTPSYYGHSVQIVSDYLGIKKEILYPVWDKLAEKVDIGEYTAEEFHKKVLESFDITKDLHEFQKIHFESYAQIPEVKDFVMSLKDNFELVLLTNFSDGFDACDKRWKMEEIFGKNIIVSCKIGMVKPNRDIFEYTLKKINRKPEETLFIDDYLVNVKAAQEIGINAIRFESLDQLKKDLVKYITI